MKLSVLNSFWYKDFRF